MTKAQNYTWDRELMKEGQEKEMSGFEDHDRRSLRLPPPLPGSLHPPAGQLAQLYFVLMAPLEEHMKRSAQAKHAQMFAAQQQLQNQNQNPSANPNVQGQPLMPAQMHLQQQNNQALGHGREPWDAVVWPGWYAKPRSRWNAGYGWDAAAESGRRGRDAEPQYGRYAEPGDERQHDAGSDASATEGPKRDGMGGRNGMGGQAQGGAMLTPAQMHVMGSGGMSTGLGGGLGGVGARLGAGVGVRAGLNGGTGADLGGAGTGMGGGLGVGGAMPPSAPMMQPQPDEGLGMDLGLGGGLGVGGKKKRELGEDEKRAKVKVGDPTPSAPTPTLATPIEYPRLDVKIFGGRALDSMIAAGGTMNRPDPQGAIVCVGHACGLKRARSSFPLVRCEDLADTLVEVLEAAAWQGEDWADSVLSGEPEFGPGVKDEKSDKLGMDDWYENEDVPI
ncbi:hypothetical protein FRC12_013820 [Ceratobasidium sp. 428]|nr:hypothetical protein FRC12_013820 [Ceratobasidium sp. 428]